MYEAIPPLHRRPNPHAAAARSLRARPDLVDFMRILCVATLALLCVGTSHAADLATVSSFDLSKAEPLTLTITLSGKAQSVRAFLLSTPERLVLDIALARLPGTKRNLAVEHPVVQGLRAAQFSPQSVRVVLDLKQAIRHDVTTRPVPGPDSGQEVVVRVLPADSPPASSIAAPPPAAPLPPVDEEPTQPDLSTTATQADTTASSSPNKKIILFGDSDSSQNATTPPSPWGSFDFSGFAAIKGAQELHESRKPEQARMFRNTVRLEEKWTPRLSEEPAGTDAETLFLLASVQSDYLGFGPNPSSDEYDLELFEGYLFRATPDWDIRLGRQRVRWGKTDQISPVDNLNPQDMREFYIPDLEDRKIPNWMARLRIFPGDLTLEGVFIPFFEENEFDYTGNTWALMGPASDDLRIEESDPGKGLDNSDWGVRLTTTIKGWDMGVSYLHATEKSPHFDFDPFNPNGPTLHADFKRQDIFGLEFETTVGKFGLRGEGAYFDRQSLVLENLDSTAKSVAHYVVGIDYIGEAEWYLNVQFSNQHIFEYDDEILFLRKDNFYLNGEINKEFWRGQTMLKLRYVIDLHDGSSFLTPETILSCFKNVELSLGANLFFGPSDTLFGRYDENNQAFLKATYFF